MKRLFLAIGIIAATISNLYAFKPKVDYQPDFFEVMEVEVLDTCTRVKMALKHRPNYWVQLDPMEKQYLIADGDTTKKYKCIGAENLEFDKHIYVRESGKHIGTLIFEKIPDNAKVLDLIAEADKPSNGIWGIHLDEEEPDYPEMIDMKKLLTEKSSEKWTGLDPERYPDIPFYSEGGTTHLRGKINNYSPMCDFSIITLDTHNEINGKKNVNLGDINPDGTFEFDVKLDYPQYAYMVMGQQGKGIFLNPGDTLDIVTTVLTDFTNPDDGYLKYFGFNGKLNDATSVNLLTRYVNSALDLDNLYKKYYVAESDTMENAIYANNVKLSQQLDKTVAELPELLGYIQASTFAKDILAAHAIGQIIDVQETNEMNFRFKNRPKMNIDSTGNLIMDDFKTLDQKLLFKPRKQHNRLIYSNPIMICAARFLENRWQFNDLFYASTAAADGTLSPYLTKKLKELMPEKKFDSLKYPDEMTGIKPIMMIDSDNERLTGVGNCFAAQISRVHSLVEHSGIFFTPTRESLKKINKLVTDLSSLVDYPSLNKALFDSYAGLAEEVALAEANATKKSEYSMVNADKNADVLTELIKPYLGNLIYIDFWGIGCGPCRSGMIAQKNILERFADKPFKVLYVAEDIDIERCNRFLDKEDIKGEHIYVSTDNWNRLRAYFNFTGIPFGVLTGKDGELLKTHFILDYPNGDKEIERHLAE